MYTVYVDSFRKKLMAVNLYFKAEKIWNEKSKSICLKKSIALLKVVWLIIQVFHK